jgi:hypothetical protein
VWVNYDAYRSAYCAAQSCWFPTRSKCELFSESCSFLGHQLKQLWASAREPTCQRRGKNSSGIWQPQFLFSQRETQNKNREGILRGRRERAKGDKWTREEKSLEQIQTNQSQYPQATRLHWTTPLSPPSKNARLHRFPRREKKCSDFVSIPQLHCTCSRFEETGTIQSSPFHSFRKSSVSARRQFLLQLLCRFS